MYYVWAFLFIVVWGGAWVLTLFGLPGNWLIALTVLLFAYLFPEQGTEGLSWTVAFFVAGIAVVGEALEFFSGAAAVAKGGSRRGALLAMVGSFAGSLFGAAVGIPIPVVGSVVGIILFASLGAMGGAILGEVWAGRSEQQSFEIGRVAFWGRLLGSLAKIIAGCVMVTTASVGALF